MAGGHDLCPSPTVAAGQVDIEEDDVGRKRVDRSNRTLDVVRFGHHLEVGGVGGQLSAHPGTYQGVVVNDEES
jgi:hypothetical protein